MTASKRTGRVAFVMADSKTRQLWTIAGDGSDLRQVAGALEPSQPTWSPNGTRVAYQSGLASLRVIGIDGRDDRLVAAVGGQLDTPQWAPRGSEVVYAHNAYPGGTTIEVVNVDAPSVPPRVLATTGGKRTFHVHWAPEGLRLSFVLPEGLFVVDARGGDPVRVAEGGDPAFAGGAPWSPDGRFLLLCRPNAGGYMSGLGGDPLERIDVASRTGKVIGESACLTPAWSPDGRLTAVVDLSQGRRTHLVVRTAEGQMLADLGAAWGVGVAWTR